ncbi:MAG: hypothetical protein Tsb0021_09130 [Chlamydiales bacterium]
MDEQHENKLKNLIEILLDPYVGVCEKDDAAMDLAEYPDDRVVEALVKIGSKESEDDTVLNSCGESLGEIWIRRNHLPIALFEQLTQVSKLGALLVVQNEKPEWIEKYTLNEIL